MAVQVTDGKVTEEQAAAALHEIVTGETEAAPDGGQEVAEGQEGQAADEAPAGEGEPAGEEAETDDVESLKKRLQDVESRQKEWEATAQSRSEAMQKRFSQNEGILRERFLRKSAVTDRALKLLEQAKSESGVDPADVERLIGEMKGTMNPASASYAPPQETASATEDQAIVLNSFLNEKRMSTQEADEFGGWLRGDAGTSLSPIEQAIAGRDLDAFLRIAHDRFRARQTEAQKATQKAEAVGAVRSVQQTQRQAARAATTTTAAPRKQPAGTGKGVDPSKLTKDDVSALLRQTVMQYR